MSLAWASGINKAVQVNFSFRKVFFFKKKGTLLGAASDDGARLVAFAFRNPIKVVRLFSQKEPRLDKRFVRGEKGL